MGDGGSDLSKLLPTKGPSRKIRRALQGVIQQMASGNLEGRATALPPSLPPERSQTRRLCVARLTTTCVQARTLGFFLLNLRAWKNKQSNCQGGRAGGGSTRRSLPCSWRYVPQWQWGRIRAYPLELLITTRFDLVPSLQTSASLPRSVLARHARPPAGRERDYDRPCQLVPEEPCCPPCHSPD